MSNELEWLTRKKRIDTKLTGINPGWTILPFKEGMDTSALSSHAITEFPTANGPADYALFVDGLLLGIIEAKRVGVGAQNVLEQAKRYSKGAFQGPGVWHGHRVPFLYSSNGEAHYFIDMRHDNATSRVLANFHTPDALREMWSRDNQSSLHWLGTNPINIERLRPYQTEAIQAVEAAIASGRRNNLLAMATGTGKTFTTVALIYRLLESKLARRVLFMVDRRALAAQAVQAFAAFQTPHKNKFDQEYEVYSQRIRKEDLEGENINLKQLDASYLTRPQSAHTYVYVSTIQRMAINLFGKDAVFHHDEDPDADKLDIPIHAFDVVIADECHRGYTLSEEGMWRRVFDHFDAIKVGLTATPAAHSVSIFGEPVYHYSTEQAVMDGFLVDYEAIAIKSNIRMNGVFLKEEERVGIVDCDTGQRNLYFMEDEREFNSSEIERSITAPDSNRKIINEVAKYLLEHERQTGRFPKTLIFAVNDIAHISHADQVVKICREVFGRGDSFVQKITGSPTVDRPLQRIREFRNRPEPRIVVTVDMLSTGVDIPAIEAIVFMRPVKSRILWTQMLGRGTRLCPEINKGHFTVFDCLHGSLIEYFRDATDFPIEVTEQGYLTTPEVIEKIYNNEDRPYYTKILVKRLQRIDKNMSGEARKKFAEWIPDGDVGAFAKDLPRQLKDDFAKTIQLLRNPQFQDLLEHYQRAKRQFWVADEAQDQVESEMIATVGPDHQKPEDYLEAFASFIKTNRNQIEAVKILSERPKDWNPNALQTLLQTLKQNRFPEKELQKAHQAVYRKALADIISMVKHAVTTTEPILSAPERVDRAMKKVTAGKSFDDDQQKWLSYIRDFLVENLSISLDDLDTMPAFEQRGGLGRARKVFGNELDSLVAALNKEIAA